MARGGAGAPRNRASLRRGSQFTRARNDAGSKELELFRLLDETTQIEPSFMHGDDALEQTRAFTRKLGAKYGSESNG